MNKKELEALSEKLFRHNQQLMMQNQSYEKAIWQIEQYSKDHLDKTDARKVKEILATLKFKLSLKVKQ